MIRLLLSGASLGRLLFGAVLALCFAAGQAQTGSENEGVGAETAVEDNGGSAGSGVDPDEGAPGFIDRTGRRCVNVHRIRSTDVIDERTILFRMRGGEVLANYLSHDCPSLAREERFSYEVRTSQLCNVDFITVIQGFGSSLRRGVSCGLGFFYPITAEEAEFLALEPGDARNPPIAISNPADDEEAPEDDTGAQLEVDPEVQD